MRNIIGRLTNKSRNDLTGNRLWINDLERRLGFVSPKVSYITYKNIEQGCLWGCNLRVNGKIADVFCVDYYWTPTAIISAYNADGIRVTEKKYIDRNDKFISIIEVENVSDGKINITFLIDTLLGKLEESHRALHNPAFIRWDNRGHEFVQFQMIVDCEARNIIREVIKPHICIYSKDFKTADDNCTLMRTIDLDGGESKRIIIAGQIQHQSISDINNLMDEIQGGHDLYSANDDYFNEWFQENVPDFSCSDSYVEKMYYYRWFIVYKNIINPEVDCFNDYCFYEGKDRFSVLCSGSSAMQINEARWLKNKEFVKGHIANLMKSQVNSGMENGRFRDTYINNIPSAVWGMCMVNDDYEMAEKYSDNLIHFVQWESSEKFVKHEDSLPIVVGSWRTASEYQPSFFEFTKPKWDHRLSAPFLKEHMTALKRVDEAVYLYMNFKAIENILIKIGRAESAEYYSKKAETLKTSIIKNMWDEETEFFYDLEPNSNQKAMQSKNYAGFTPALTDIASADGGGLFKHLENPNEFLSAFPIPSVSKDCPAYNADNQWTAGPAASVENPYRYGCCWNGPAWNFSNSIVIDALGEFIQRQGFVQKKTLYKTLFSKWTAAQYIDGDISSPNTCEHFHPDTGKHLSGVTDYFHSTYNDILIKRIIGIIPEDSDVLTLNPIDMGWDYFSLEGLTYRNKKVDVFWKSPQYIKKNEGEQGLVILINGRRAANSKTLQKIQIDLRQY